MTMNVNIRRATPEDAHELHRLNEIFSGEWSNSSEGIADSLRMNDREAVYVADVENQLVGFSCGQIFRSMCYPSPYAEITELFVSEEYRRQGIGRRLMEHMEADLRKRGVNHFHILTLEKNISAQALYRSLGYKETSEILLEK